mgnify:FL=1
MKKATNEVRRYVVPINEAEDGGSVTCDIISLSVDPRKRRQEWRRYLSVRVPGTSEKEARRIARKLGFKGL